MLLGHGAIGQFGVAEALPGFVVNAGTSDVTLGQSSSFSIGTETVAASAVFAVSAPTPPSFTLGTEVATGGANVSPTGSEATLSVGDETAFGEAFQNLISLSVGEPDFFIWNEIDDSMTATYTDVEPGSTD